MTRVRKTTNLRYERAVEPLGHTNPTRAPLATHLLAELDGVPIRVDRWECPPALAEGVVYVRDATSGEPLDGLMESVHRSNGSTYNGVDDRALADAVREIVRGIGVGTPPTSSGGALTLLGQSN